MKTSISKFLRSRHAAPAWAAIYGEKGLTPDEVNFSEQYQPGGTRRPPHPFVQLKGQSAMISGCEQCHSVGKPNQDGTIGSCTACHTRHISSVRIARLPSTCAQCHTDPIIRRSRSMRNPGTVCFFRRKSLC
jgi:hydroxylamine dehydrogenase